MYISLKWVQNVIGLENLSLSVLCDRLTLSGFEIEEIVKKTNFNEVDFVLDVSLTANRSDLFNVKGFIQELRSISFNEKELFNTQTSEIISVNSSILNHKPLHTKFFVWENFLQNKLFYKNKIKPENLSNFEACSAFFSMESNLVEVNSAPVWLQKRLISANITPINNIIDTLNFVRVETGYPFFALDLNKLKKGLNLSTLSFRTCFAKSDQTIEIEKDKIIKLQPNNLLLLINKKPISILGLLNLKEFEIDNTTTAFLVFAGIFDPVQIRKSSQSLGIRTEQSVNLEKNLNFNGLEQAYIRLCLVFNVQGIKFKTHQLPNIEKVDVLNKISFCNYVKNKRPIIKLKYEKVINLLGSSILLNKSTILNILKNLNFQILKESENSCSLYVPYSRELDIEREVDLIEEIVRIVGFNSFISIVPPIDQIGKFSKLEKLKRLLRKAFIELGFNEVFHYSLNTIQSKKQVELKNPIVPENSYFRINLLNQLIQKAAINKKQKNNALEAFEIGRIYSLVNENIIETELISGIFGGNFYFSTWNEEGKLINWFEAKGLIEHLFSLLGISPVWEKLKDKDINLLHPGRSAQLFINNQFLGVFGQIHPHIAKTNSLNNDTFLFEFKLEVLKTQWQVKQIYNYKPYSLFPASLIDLACIKKNEISFKDVETKIREIAGPLLESVNLFDYYSGLPIPPGYHSLGFKLKFRNIDRTLTNEEVENIVKNIRSSLEKDFSIIIRK
jgi:phenylalanyl-tRNA synthetase beta chain